MMEFASDKWNRFNDYLHQRNDDDDLEKKKQKEPEDDIALMQGFPERQPVDDALVHKLQTVVTRAWNGIVNFVLEMYFFEDPNDELAGLPCSGGCESINWRA